MVGKCSQPGCGVEAGLGFGAPGPRSTRRTIAIAHACPDHEPIIRARWAAWVAAGCPIPTRGGDSARGTDTQPQGQAEGASGDTVVPADGRLI